MAFPPNFVHSLDGSHMMMTAIACRKAGLQFAGLISFLECLSTMLFNGQLNLIFISKFIFTFITGEPDGFEHSILLTEVKKTPWTAFGKRRKIASALKKSGPLTTFNGYSLFGKNEMDQQYMWAPKLVNLCSHAMKMGNRSHKLYLIDFT